MLEDLLARARADENVVGVIHSGSEVTLEVLPDPPAWARPAFLSGTPLLDKTGEVAEALQKATTVDPATAADPLDAYVNSYYRAAKNAWLEWELREHPLPVVLDLARLERIARTGDLPEQQALFRETEAPAREHGHGATIDGWEPDLAWLRG